MCRVQQTVNIPVPVTDGNEYNAVAVVSNRNSENDAKKRGRGHGSFRASLLLGAGFLAILLSVSPCLCSFYSGQPDHSKGDAFYGGTKMTNFYLGFPSTDVYQDSPPKINAQLRYAHLPPIPSEASSMQSPSEDSNEVQRYGSSLSYPSKDGVRRVTKTDKRSDSKNASERASLEHKGILNSIASEDADFTPKTISSEDALKSSHENDPVIGSPMKGRRSVIDPTKNLLRQS